MITELTEEQKKMMPVYVDKWAKIGLSCEPVKDYEETINLFYEKILNKKRPAKVILASSPLHAWKEVEISGQTLWDVLEIKAQIWEQLREQAFSHIDEQISDELSKQVLHQIMVQLRERVWEAWEVREQVVEQRVAVELRDDYPLLGAFPFGVISCYDYFCETLDIQYPEKLFIYKRIVEMGLIYPFDDICIMSNRPELIIMKNGILHNESGMAIKYRDGWGVYYLNGVRVTKEIVETPADKLDPEIVLKEANAEVRREIVRKIGVERLEKKLKPRVLDKWGDYELHDYSHLFPNMRCKPVYLKMKNPSIGVWDYEGVNINEMETPTCQAALKWRLKGKDFKPIRIT